MPLMCFRPGADAADVLQDLDVGVDDGVAERGDVHAAEDGEGGLRADAVHREQELEDFELLLFREPEELEGVLAYLEPGQERGGAAFLRQDVVSAHWDGDEIPDAVHVEDDFGEVQGNDLACELSDHVGDVLFRLALRRIRGRLYLNTIHAFAGKSSAGQQAHVTAVQPERAPVVLVQNDRAIVRDVAEEPGEAGAVPSQEFHVPPEEPVFGFPAGEERVWIASERGGVDV